MKQLFGIILCVFALIFSTGAVQASNGKFYVPINRSEIITTPVNMGEVIVSNPDIADVYVHGKDKVSIIGKALGETSVRLFDENNKLIRDMDVLITYDLPAIRKAMHEFLPHERVGVEMVNTKVALTGEVTSAEAAKTAIDIAEQFLVPSRDASEVEEIEVDRISPIINLMRVSAGQQVMLRIRIGEMQRGTLKTLGVGLNAVKGTGDVPFSVLSGGTLASRFVSATASYSNGSGTNSLSATIDALERDNLLKILAEPNLVALSGETAEFLSGGEIPIPIAQDADTISVEFKPFGVSVRFTPYVLSESRIRIEVQPEVSERNDAAGIGIGGGVTVPAFDVRKASTTVELSPGESFMIAGLMKDSLNTSIDQIPGVSEIPVLSSIFRTTSYDRTETELVMAVTPYLVDPLKSSDIRLPTDNFRPASFMESVFYGAMGSLNGNVERLSQTPSIEGPIGFMVD